MAGREPAGVVIDRRLANSLVGDAQDWVAWIRGLHGRADIRRFALVFDLLDGRAATLATMERSARDVLPGLAPKPSRPARDQEVAT